jgi:HSP20 family molecular chaperone IbpA
MTTETHVKQDTEQKPERTRGGQVYRPSVDIVELEGELMIVADVPGAKSEAIEIDFEEGVLTIQGRVEPRYGEGRRFLVREYGIGDFHRTFRVSEKVNAAGITAECADGVLRVHLPKAESAKPRKIEVKSG